jgi:hypothetical protein
MCANQDTANGPLFGTEGADDAVISVSGLCMIAVAGGSVGVTNAILSDWSWPGVFAAYVMCGLAGLAAALIRVAIAPDRCRTGRDAPRPDGAGGRGMPRV